MARQVAHEVKNPLTPIQLSAEHLRRVFRDGREDFAGTLDACTTTILQQVATLREIVTEFSAFARPPAAVPEAQAPLRLVDEVLAPYRTVLPPGVLLSVSAEEDLPAIEGDRRLLGRAVVNLVENALQAVGDSGRIEIGLRTSEAGQRVELTVTDSGPGIDPALVERVFEPFFSTKSGGQRPRAASRAQDRRGPRRRRGPRAPAGGRNARPPVAPRPKARERRLTRYARALTETTAASAPSERCFTREPGLWYSRTFGRTIG